MPIAYQLESDLTPTEFVDVLERSGLAERRPLEDLRRVQVMLENSGLIVTARSDDGILIGVSRCITDFALVCYCSDLAVDSSWQGLGIGRELLYRSRAEAGQHCMFHLLSSPSAMSYYTHVGLEKLDMCFGIYRTSRTMPEVSA